MRLLFSSVSCGMTVLAKQSTAMGNFKEVAEKVLVGIDMTNHQMTFRHGEFLINYICADKIIYLCITDNLFDRARSFRFLNEIKKKFLNKYGSMVHTALAYAMNNEFAPIMAEEMKNCCENKNYEPMSKIQSEIADVKKILTKNIEELDSRGDKLIEISNNADALVNNAVAFHDNGRDLRRRAYWRNKKMYIIIGGVCIVLLYFIVSGICGGLLWKKCV